MKGITPVIAIILLLLITISMVGFAFVWFQRVAQTATDSTDTQLQTQLNQQSQKLRIDGVAGDRVTMRSTGSQSIPDDSISLLINGANAKTAGVKCPNGPAGAGTTFTCVMSVNCTTGQKVRATAPGNIDEATC